jgi:hypothetical protein
MEKYHCSNEECDWQLTWEDRNFYYAVAGDSVMCDECEDRYEKEKKSFMPVGYEDELKKIQETRRNSHVHEIFSDIFAAHFPGLK